MNNTIALSTKLIVPPFGRVFDLNSLTNGEIIRINTAGSNYKNPNRTKGKPSWNFRRLTNSRMMKGSTRIELMIPESLIFAECLLRISPIDISYLISRNFQIGSLYTFAEIENRDNSNRVIEKTAHHPSWFLGEKHRLIVLHAQNLSLKRHSRQEMLASPDLWESSIHAKGTARNFDVFMYTFDKAYFI